MYVTFGIFLKHFPGQTSKNLFQIFNRQSYVHIISRLKFEFGSFNL